ncbi:Sir2 family NAD-dependent protein deacetylase [Archangium sp.]|uniref:SIR2 family NAD-dependent protein deacylase n=1 Tax=Archangium sp. TaxID=1872627 RepID=UPI00286D35B8|nr:Sir2 family NAD-dependent protein deacetylase [Archangium sp.]
MSANLKKQLETAAEWFAASQHMVAFTGAGISTDSGLPDFRGPDGVWTRRDAGLPPPRWDKPASQIRPNVAHDALVQLERLGKLQFLISQNVDNLHLESGFPGEKLAELHGNGKLMRCLACDSRFTFKQVGWDRRVWGEGYRTQRPLKGQPRCPVCTGRIISSVVNFGDPLPAREIQEAFAHSERSDVFFAIGSSLVVSPANEMPRVALEMGARLILLNRGETPFDELAHLRIEAGIGEVLPPVLARVKELLGADAHLSGER